MGGVGHSDAISDQPNVGVSRLGHDRIANRCGSVI